MFKTTLLQTSVSLRLNMAKITDNTAVSLFIYLFRYSNLTGTYFAHFHLHVFYS